MAAKILFVDDEPHILNALNRLFMDEPYEIMTFGSPLKALEKMGEEEVAVVVADHEMPEMKGTAFLEKVRDRWPNTIRIILTGHANFENAIAAINKGKVYRFISKPWDNNEFKMTIHNAINHYELLLDNKDLFELTGKQNEKLVKLNQSLEAKVEERTKNLKRNDGKLKKTLEKLREALNATIQAIAMIVEARDAYTAGHQRRVAGLAGAIAVEMGLSKKQIEAIKMAGVIHDLGKIFIPAEILGKPNRLSEIEFSLIKTHPQAAYDILKDIELPCPVAQIILQHHERMDGSGYPERLLGEDILIEARIMSVADVVEAMASHRPYRAALGMEKALEEISRGRGILYDPGVADACLRLINEKGFKFE